MPQVHEMNELRPASILGTAVWTISFVMHGIRLNVCK